MKWRGLKNCLKICFFFFELKHTEDPVYMSVPARVVTQRTMK